MLLHTSDSDARVLARALSTLVVLSTPGVRVVLVMFHVFLGVVLELLRVFGRCP